MFSIFFGQKKALLKGEGLIYNKFIPLTSGDSNFNNYVLLFSHFTGAKVELAMVFRKWKFLKFKKSD
jgi:hypothetical protein